MDFQQFIQQCREALGVAGLELRHGLDAVGTFLAANIDTQTYLERDPLVTINSVGIAMALFALEQRLATQNRQLRSKSAAKRSKLARRAMDATFFAGLPHMASIMWVLMSRHGCEQECPSAERVTYLATATNYTFIGMGALLIAIFLLICDVVGNPIRFNRPPSILASGGQSGS